MNHLQIPEKNIDLYYPANYDEMTPEQAIAVGRILFMTYKGIIDYDMARKMAVDVFINRKNSQNKPKLDEKGVDYWANEATLADSVNFLFEIVTNKEGKTAFSINPKFCKQLIPIINTAGKTYYGAEDLISDLSIMEYKEAAWRIGKFSESKDEHWLDEICALLYAQEEIDGAKGRMGEGMKGQRRAYTNERFIAGIEDLQEVPIGTKFMAFLFFTGCMNWIKEEDIIIDGKPLNFGCLFNAPNNQGSTRAGDDTGMAGVLFQIAESGVFGNMEQTCKINVWDIFLRLYQIHMQSKNLKT